MLQFYLLIYLFTRNYHDTINEKKEKVFDEEKSAWIQWCHMILAKVERKSGKQPFIPKCRRHTIVAPYRGDTRIHTAALKGNW